MEVQPPLKILLILPFFYPHRGGSQKYAEEIYVSMLKQHPEAKVDVLAYNTDKAPDLEEYRDLTIYRIPCWSVIPARFALPNPVALLKMLRRLSGNNYNYVNTHIRFFDPTWWVWIYARAIKAQSFFTGHVATHPVHQKKLVEKVSRLVDLTLARYSLGHYDLLTFTNKTAQQFFKNSLQLRKDSHIIYGGVNTEFFKPGNKQDRVIPKVNKHVDNDVVVVTFVGRMIWTKGVTYLYAAIQEVIKETGTQALFVLAGPGELEMMLREKIKNDGLQDKVIMTGDLSYEQVRDLLAISDIFINPSHHNEGFPNTVLEGGASGCYVIATDNAGTWEVIRDKETGALIPQKSTKAIKEALLWSIKNKDKREKIAMNFRNELVHSFDWKIVSEQLYRLLIRSRKSE